MNIKQNLNEFCNIIAEIDSDLCTNNKTKTLIFADIAILKESAIRGKFNVDICKYELAPMRIKLPHKPAKCRPYNLRNIEITLEIKNEISLPIDSNKISDPVKKLNFDILIKGDERNICSWHLDKHSQLTNDSDGENKFIHPEYHFCYGGEKMEDEILDYGKTLLLRSPRLMHPPLDVILGIDFVINQFIPKVYSQPFIKNPVYDRVVTEMKKLIWKPYTLAFANNFYDSWSDGLNFDEGYSKSLIG